MNTPSLRSRNDGDAGHKEVTSESFRHVMQHFGRSVTIVTTCKDRLVWGMTATAVCGVSQCPPVILACVSRNCRTHSFIRDSGVFAVNLLRCGQEHLAERFAGRHPESSERFDGLEFQTVVTGAPVLKDCLVFADCRVVDWCGCGDHSVFVGYVEAAEQLNSGSPLVRHMGRYTKFEGAATL